jgi:hypothetical protein
MADKNYKTNRSTKYDPTGFNNNFESKDKPLLNTKRKDYDVDLIILPHKQPFEKIIIDMRDLIFKILEMLEEKTNPIPFIFANEERKFHFSVILILFGCLFLLLASLMKS